MANNCGNCKFRREIEIVMGDDPDINGMCSLLSHDGEEQAQENGVILAKTVSVLLCNA